MDGIRGKGIGRRDAIRILAAGTLGWPGLPGWTRAMGNRPKPDGIHRLSGDVRINGQPAKAGDLVRAGDVVTTGPEASVLFAAEGSVYLIRDDSQISFTSDHTKTGAAIRTLKTLNGKTLSVFGDGPHTIETATSIAGVRGSGI